jgi:hypothetical protein
MSLVKAIMKNTPVKHNLFGALFVISILVSLNGCGGADVAPSAFPSYSSATASAGASVGTSDTSNVVYIVSGTAAKADLTYRDDMNVTKQETVSLPWSRSFKFKADDFMYIAAQNNTNTGSVTSEIRINGAVFKAETKSGAYVISTATGSCCKLN